MKYGQLIEYNMRHIFLEKSFTERGRETSLRPFSKKVKTDHISESIVYKSIV